MTTIIIHNGSKCAGERPDNLNILFDRLKKYTLNNHQHIIKSKDTISFYGNFVEYAGNFHVEVAKNSKDHKTLDRLFKSNKGFIK